MTPDEARARQREDEFLALLRQGGTVSSGGLFDAPEPGLRCLLPECPDPAHAVAPLPALLAEPILPARAVHPGWFVPNLLWRTLWLTWGFVRQISGDDAYERYLGHMTRMHPGRQPMTRAEHFAWRQEQKWNRLSRCC
ncbi:MAG: YbdD/YjiX family protein [Burkholderiales bacterium]|nr:YbdD/YjiX family protein [Burkholderiales bacterium]